MYDQYFIDNAFLIPYINNFNDWIEKLIINYTLEYSYSWLFKYFIVIFSANVMLYKNLVKINLLLIVLSISANEISAGNKI